jgi:TetR/AcrR family transcriptional regulator, fatty acid metabolism regulator protein
MRRGAARGGSVLRALGGRKARPRRSAALRAQAREVYRDAILAAAEHIFARRGFAGTRMADVAREAGLATGTLYNYFAGRDELLSSLVALRSEQLLDAVKHAAAAAASSAPRDLLVAIIRTSFEHFQTHRALFAVLPAAAGISGRHMASIARRCMESQRSYQAVIAEALDRAVRAGLVRSDVPLSVMVGYLTGAAHGVMRAWMAHETEQPLVDQVADVVDLFLRGASAVS